MSGKEFDKEAFRKYVNMVQRALTRGFERYDMEMGSELEFIFKCLVCLTVKIITQGFEKPEETTLEFVELLKKAVRHELEDMEKEEKGAKYEERY